MDILGSSPYVERDDGDEPKKDGAAAKLREKIETKAEANAEKDKIAADRRAAVRSIAEAVGYDMKAVQTVLQQVNAGKDAANIARYSCEQTGIEDEIVVNEIISRATTAGLLKTKQEPKLEDKAPETPKTAPAVPPAAETKLEANKGKRGAPSNTKFAAIAQQEGVSVEIVGFSWYSFCCSASRNSSANWYRSSGRVARALQTMASSTESIAGSFCDGGMNLPWHTARAIWR